MGGFERALPVPKNCIEKFVDIRSPGLAPIKQVFDSTNRVLGEMPLWWEMWGKGTIQLIPQNMF